MIVTNASPIHQIKFDGSSYYIKRDDLLDKHFSGNKARKFHYYLHHDFPNIKKIISHGSAQSNAMYSLSVLAKIKGWEFDYHVSHIASYLSDNPHGNYKAALENGMNIKTEPFSLSYHDSILFIPEGGSMKESEYGISLLAKEINESYKDKNIDIFLPSGTGTTALYLQKHTDFQVYTTPCVGDSAYLIKQFYSLETDSRVFPKILNLEKKYHFGKLYREFFEIWIKLNRECDITFDLLYDPKGWLTLLAHKSLFKNDILYIHQGGLLGNESMLKRYGRKFHEDYRE